MENQNTDILKDVKTTFTKEVVKINLINALREMKHICEKREYVVRGSFDNIINELNFDDSTLTSRKKLARKIYYFMKKKSRRTMSALISFTKRKFIKSEYELSIKPSLLEQEIDKMREEYKTKRAELEVLRVTFKEKKKELFFKNQKPFNIKVV